MAKTLVALNDETILDTIVEDRLKEACRIVNDVNTGKAPADALMARAQDVHDLQVLADQFTDAGKGISDRIKDAEGRLYAEFGEVSKGFKVKNTGYSSSINDVAAFVFEAERDGANMEELWKYVKISPKDAAKWLGLSEERFEAEYGDYVEKKKKADTLVREY